MRYISTRGGSPERSFEEIVIGGLAPDGGLYLPERYPQLDLDELRGASYQAIAFKILSLFAPEIPSKDRASIVAKSYTQALFGSRDIVPVQSLGDGYFKLGLSEGPTLAFKDLALQLLGNLMEYLLEKYDAELNILGATSGDTGSAAEEALRGKRRLRVFMLSPKGRMSRVQQMQMYGIDDPRIFNLVLDGTFDDGQAIVKQINADKAFKERYKIGAINSINWARIVAQVVYYVWGYLKVTQHKHQDVYAVVPSGNFGNAFSAYIAMRMGVPLKIVVATNENDVLHEFFRSNGVYWVRKNVKVTSSPSMDITSASNFERLLFELAGRDASIVRHFMQTVSDYGSADASVLDPRRYSGIISGNASEDEVEQAMRYAWEKWRIIIDPHTAVGLSVAQRLCKPGIPVMFAETAKAAKFGPAVKRALGFYPEFPTSIAMLDSMEEHVTHVANDAELVKEFIAARAA